MGGLCYTGSLTTHMFPAMVRDRWVVPHRVRAKGVLCTQQSIIMSENEWEALLKSRYASRCLDIAKIQQGCGCHLFSSSSTPSPAHLTPTQNGVSCHP